MSKIFNFYGTHVGISELNLDDFDIKYKLIKKKNLFLIKKTGNQKNKLKKEFIGKNGLIIFYSTGCSKCKEKIDFWINIASNFLYNFPIYAVNCDNLKNNNDYLLPLLNIQFYPHYVKFDEDGIISNLKIDINLEDVLYYIYSNVN
jgi:hypothetical protein